MPSLSPKNPSKAVVLMKSKELMKSKMDPRKPLTQRPHSYPSFKKSKTPVLNQLFQSRNLEFLDKERMKRQETKTKSFLYTIINPRSRQWPALCFKLLISNVIIFDFISFIISTEPKYRNNDFKFFDITEGITSSIFLLEYLVRLYTITENKKFGHLGKFWGRIRFVMTLGSIIDLTATLPFFIQHYSGLELPKLSYLRTFRLFRILKTPSFVKAIDAVYRVIYYNREIMYLSLFVGLFMILTTSVLMFYLRPRNEYKSDGELDLSP